jgi:hypothetical protein
VESTRSGFQPVGEPIGVGSVVTAAAFSRDGRTLATGSIEVTIRLWDVGDHTQLEDLSGHMELPGHTEAVTSLAFSPDGAKLLSASRDHTMRMWPVPKVSPDALCARLTHDMSRKSGITSSRRRSITSRCAPGCRKPMMPARTPPGTRSAQHTADRARAGRTAPLWPNSASLACDHRSTRAAPTAGGRELE